ncbi:MAG: acyl carrier protein [Guyparkeria sp.]
MSQVSAAPDPLFQTVRKVILDTLDLPGPAQRFTPQSGLFGEIPELDSMGVVLLLTALEDRFDIQLSDDEVDAEWFATFGTVTEFIRART